MDAQRSASQGYFAAPVLVVVLLAGCSAANACQSPIEVLIEDGRLVAQFKLGGSSCSLVDDQMRCTPAER